MGCGLQLFPVSPNRLTHRLFSPGGGDNFRRDRGLHLGRPDDRHSPLPGLRLRHALGDAWRRLRQNGRQRALARQFRRKQSRSEEIRQFGELGQPPVLSCSKVNAVPLAKMGAKSMSAFDDRKKAGERPKRGRFLTGSFSLKSSDRCLSGSRPWRARDLCLIIGWKAEGNDDGHSVTFIV